MLPPYVYDLIAAVQQWEDEHAKGDVCFNAVLSTVPAEELDRAAAIAAYNRQTIPVMVVDGHAYRMPPFGHDDALASPEAAPRPPMSTRCRCVVQRAGDATDVQEPLNRAVRRALYFNQKHGLSTPEEFQLNPADAERFDVADAQYVDVDNAKYALTTNPDAEPGWLRIFSDGRWRGDGLPFARLEG